MEFISKKITINSHDIHYIESTTGAPDGNTIFCVHGFPGACGDYRKLAEYFEGDCRFISVDLLGCGKSDKPLNMEYSIQAQADYLVDLVKHLDLKNIVLIGHSYGGAVCQRIAANAPDRVKGLVLLASIGSIPHIIYKKLIPVMRVMYRILTFPKGYKIIRPAAIVGLKKSGFPPNMAKDEVLLTILCKTAVKIDFKRIGEDAEKILCPTLYISCKNDPFVQLEVRDVLKRKIRRFGYVELEGNDHLVQSSHTREVFGFMKSFIDKLE